MGNASQMTGNLKILAKALLDGEGHLYFGVNIILVK